jgi:hypothetical protein
MTNGFSPFDFGSEPDDNILLRQTGLDYLKSSRGQFFKASTGLTLSRNLTQSAFDKAEVDELDRKETPWGEGFRRAVLASKGLDLDTYYKAPSRRLSVEEANERFGIEGALTFDKPIREDAARRLQELKQEELEKLDIIKRYDATPLEKVGQIGLDIVATMMDPVQLGAMFVPIVGETRAAAWAAKYGTTRARLMTGAVEAGVGSTALEPFILANNKALNYDYNEWDSFMNIAFGTVIGSGLHAGLGKIGDLIDKRYISPTAHNKAAQTAVGQLLDDKPVNIKSILDADKLNYDPEVRLQDVQFRKETSVKTTLDTKIRTSPNKADLTIRKVGNTFEAKFINEKGYLSGTKGIGSTAEDAISNLKDNYNLLLDESPGQSAKAKALEQLQKEYDELSSTSGSSRFIDNELRKNGYPVSDIESLEYRLLELESQRNDIFERVDRGEIKAKGKAKKLAPIDEQIANIKKELSDIRRADNQDTYNNAVNKLREEQSILKEKINQLRDNIDSDKIENELIEYNVPKDNIAENVRSQAYNQQNTDSLIDNYKNLGDIKINNDVISVKNVESEIESAIEYAKMHNVPDEELQLAIQDGNDIIELANREANATEAAVYCVFRKGL